MPPRESGDPFEVLGVPSTATPEEIKRAYEPRRVVTGEGPIEVQVPQVRDPPEDAEGFHSKILEAYASRNNGDSHEWHEANQP